MKLAGEWLVRDYTRRTGMAHVVIRPSAVYGPLDVEDRVVSKFLLTAMRDGVLNVNGKKECLDFTYVDDVAQGIADAAVSRNTINTTYNITRGHARSLLEAAELCVAIVGGGRVEIRLPDTEFPTRGQLNTQRARLDFEFDPQVDIEQGFRNYHAWLANSIYRT
jgi:nucleoside-diphosphate-sugar epimerase